MKHLPSRSEGALKKRVKDIPEGDASTYLSVGRRSLNALRDGNVRIGFGAGGLVDFVGSGVLQRLMIAFRIVELKLRLYTSFQFFQALVLVHMDISCAPRWARSISARDRLRTD